MSEYTPITGELRERIGQAEHIVPLSGDSKDTQVRINLAWLKEKLDAIDSIHAQLERENAALKAELDRVLGEQDNGAIIPLPLDMNGEPIHIGDVMVMDGDSELREVVGFYKEGFFAWLNGRFVPCVASLYRHVTPDTWERIISDATALGAEMGRRTSQIDDLVARCKALCERTKEEDA